MSLDADRVFRRDDGSIVDLSSANNEGMSRYVDLGGDMGLMFFDGEARPLFRHRCDRGERGILICAPALNPAHVITESASGVTVRASVLCPDCNTHGFITDSAWTSC